MTWPPGASSRERSATLPDYTPAIYGSLLVTTLIAVQWTREAVPELIALSLVVAVGVFWLTHVWSSIVNRRIRERVTLREALGLARSEDPMLAAIVVPALVLALHRAANVTVDTAIALALAASIVQLFLWGLAVGWAAHDRWWLALGVALVDAGLGIAIVLLKVLVLH
jgi:hypothetical protein